MNCTTRSGSRTKKLALRLPTMALFALLSILALGGCGGGSSSSSSSGGGQETTSSSRVGEETTAFSSKTDETTTSAAGGETTAATINLTNATLDLTPSRDSGVSGTAVLTENPGALVVTLNLQHLGTAPGTEHLAHIHEGGTCEDDRAGNGAPAEYLLNPVVTQPDGGGSSTTMLEGVTLEQLETGTEKYVNVDAERTRGDVVPPGIACADIPFIIP